MNTLKKGQVRTIIFEENGVWYGVALEFNIVESGDHQDVVYANLQEAMRGYVDSLQKIHGARPGPLNQNTDPQYEKLWAALDANKPVPSPIKVLSYGFTRV